MSFVINSRRPVLTIWPVVMTLCAILLAVGVFTVTQAVKQREANVNELNRKILAEQQTMRVLDAEWAYLTRPQRLEELMALKLARDTMPPTPSPIAPIEAAEEAAEAPVAVAPEKVEPAAGAHDVAPPEKPKTVAKTVSVKKEEPVKKLQKAVVAVKKEKPAAPKVVHDDFVWSPKKNTHPSKTASAQPAPFTKRAGVARPILE